MFTLVYRANNVPGNAEIRLNDFLLFECWFG
jgi:hypothetical protein